MRAFIACILFAFVSFVSSGQAIDRLGVSGPISFNKASYNLSWTSHPSAQYYKQEYLQAGENQDRYKMMLMLEVLKGSSDLKAIVGGKMKELEGMKASNPIVNYTVYERGTEYLLDFLVSENSADGKTVKIIERNVYHYTTAKDKAGKPMIVLFAASERAYGNDVTPFLKALKGNKNLLIDAVGGFSIPTIKTAD